MSGGDINFTVGTTTKRVRLHDSEISETSWDAFVAGAGGRIAQTSGWANVKSALGWEPVRVAICGDGPILAGAQVLVRRMGRVGSIGYLDGGPLVLGGDSDLARSVISELIQACSRHHIRNLTVDPVPGTGAVNSQLREAGFGSSHVKTALAATVEIVLDTDDDGLLARMKSTTRRNVRKSQKGTLEIHRTGQEGVADFHALMELTAQRQGFTSPSRGYFESMFDHLGGRGQVHLFIASRETVPVSAILVTAFGDRVVYKRGAWSGEHGDLRPNEGLHFAAMRWARDSGYRIYDMDGIEPDIAKLILSGAELPPLENVTRFKLGFGGAVVLLPESMSYVPNRLLRVGYNHLYPYVKKSAAVKRVVGKLRNT